MMSLADLPKHHLVLRRQLLSADDGAAQETPFPFLQRARAQQFPGKSFLPLLTQPFRSGLAARELAFRAQTV